jgi:hypothetical protein
MPRGRRSLAASPHSALSHSRPVSRQARTSVRDDDRRAGHRLIWSRKARQSCPKSKRSQGPGHSSGHPRGATSTSRLSESMHALLQTRGRTSSNSTPRRCGNTRRPTSSSVIERRSPSTATSPTHPQGRSCSSAIRLSSGQQWRRSPERPYSQSVPGPACRTRLAVGADLHRQGPRRRRQLRERDCRAAARAGDPPRPIRCSSIVSQAGRRSRQE